MVKIAGAGEATLVSEEILLLMTVLKQCVSSVNYRLELSKEKDIILPLTRTMSLPPPSLKSS